MTGRMSVKEAFRLDDLQHTGAVMQRTGVVTVVIIEEKTYKWFSTTVQMKYVQMPFANSLSADYKSISPEGGTKKGLQRWLHQHLYLCFHCPKGDRTKRNGSAKHPPLTFMHWPKKWPRTNLQ